MKVDAARSCLKAKHPNNLIEEFPKTNFVAVELKPSGLDLRDIKKAIDQAR